MHTFLFTEPNPYLKVNVNKVNNEINENIFKVDNELTWPSCAKWDRILYSSQDVGSYGPEMTSLNAKSFFESGFI